jgi:aminopeptidase N
MFTSVQPKNTRPALLLGALLIASGSLLAQNASLARLHEHARAVRTPFLVQGCHAVGCTHDEPATRGFLPVDNFDMGPSIARSDSFDVAHYELFLDVTDYAGQSLDAHATITFTVLQGGGTSMWWDLKGLDVDSVTWNGNGVAFAQWGQELHVQSPAPMAEGEAVTLDVWYGGQPDADPYWGGVYYASDLVYNLGIGLTSIPPNFGRVWYPCFDNFVERATYTYHIQSAGGRRAHNQGHLVEEVQLGGDTLLCTWALDHPIPTHLSAMAVGPYVDHDYTHEGAYGDIPVRLTSKAADTGVMQQKFADLGYAIDALEYWWGPYAWERVGYILTTDGALEIPTNIAYPRFMVEQSNFANGDLFAHELGHHWWGDLVAPTIHNHMWLKEGPAEYSSHLFVEWKDGHEAFVDLVKDNQQFVLEECHVQDDGFHPLSPMPDEHIYGRHTYYKGASIMHNLRAYLGDDLFRTAAQDVIAARFDSHMDVADFELLLEEATGEDLTPFFAAQALQPGFSTWVVDSLSTGPDNGCFATTVHLHQKLRACDNFHDNEPLDLTLWNANWDTTLVHARVGGEFDEITFWHEEPFVLLGLNADGRLNQGRLDHTFAVTEPTGLANLPWVDMRVGCDEVTEGDSVLVRVEHHWAAPDQGPKAAYVEELSGSHFWVVDGTWDDGASNAPLLDARLNYVGNDVADLDYDLYGETEEGGFLAWRPHAGAPWVQYPDYDWQAGSLSNGSGLFKISKLRKGHYAFAKGDVSVGLAEATPSDLELTLHPNPCSDVLRWEGLIAAHVYNSAGQLLLTEPASRQEISVSALPVGAYEFRLMDREGRSQGSATFVVTR